MKEKIILLLTILALLPFMLFSQDKLTSKPIVFCSGQPLDDINNQVTTLYENKRCTLYYFISAPFYGLKTEIKVENSLSKIENLADTVINKTKYSRALITPKTSKFYDSTSQTVKADYWVTLSINLREPQKTMLIPSQSYGHPITYDSSGEVIDENINWVPTSLADYIVTKMQFLIRRKPED